MLVYGGKMQFHGPFMLSVVLDKGEFKILILFVCSFIAVFQPLVAAAFIK